RMEKALNIWFDPKKEPFDVTLLLDHNAIVYFERKPIKGQFLKTNSDGTGELAISITNKDEIFPLMNKWLPQMRIIEPPELQEEFEGMMRKYLVRN
ncbi:MAG: WYL domain-containing protein, partial [Campylobacterota bacterium]|nr:WYL domain-containing protein [Campylobacterota bacterium]